MKMIPKAVEVFNKTLDLSGSTGNLREEIADFCIENEILDYAGTLLQSVLTDQPNIADLLFKLGKALENLGEISRALTHLNRADQIDK